MAQTPRVLDIAGLLVVLAVGGTAFASEPLKVTTRLPPGSHFVGEAVRIEVEVEGAAGALSFEAPRLSHALIQALATDPARPTLGRFLVVPERSGTLEIPPFRVRSGERSGASRSCRLTVGNVPAEGRTAAFLGGVGTFEVRAEVTPASLTIGQTFEYRIRLAGPAAWGSDRAPTIDLTHLVANFRVEPLPEVREGVDPPSRTFRYRLRASRAGRVVLPPVAIAAFEPRSGRFVTRTTSGLPVVVLDRPQFDPDRLDYQPNGTIASRWRIAIITLVLGFAALATLGLWFIARRNRRSRPANPAALALELARDLTGSDDEVESAGMVTQALTIFLQQVDGRGSGVLTPQEAREGIDRVTNEADLARSAELLVLRCDRARYGSGGEDAADLIAGGRQLFETIAMVLREKGRREEGPREAVETVGE